MGQNYNLTLRISPAFDNFIFDWDYETYLAIGSYGSGKSYGIAQKIFLKLLQEKRKVAVFRQVHDTHCESTFDLLKEVIEKSGMLAPEGVRTHKRKVCWKVSPLQFKFPNGSRIIFKGMDSTEKLKSLNGVSIVWIEECSEIEEAGFNELLGRIRTPKISMHFILSCNPIGKFNWVYQRFFSRTQEDGTVKVKVKDETFYNMQELICTGIYYHHSTCESNPFLPVTYIRRLDEMKNYDKALWLVARLGRFGIMGLRVLPQFETRPHKFLMQMLTDIGEEHFFCGMDFGFETSYNAVVKCAVDDKKKILYIYDEYYKNKMTDDKTAVDLISWDEDIKDTEISADCAEPKAIQYYRQQGFKGMRKCSKKTDGTTKSSRIANIKKMKRFKRIICSRRCINTIAELKDLTYKKNKDGSLNFGEFNIDAHTFSALWYALDRYTVADYKKEKPNTKAGR